MKNIVKRWEIIFCILLFPTVSHGQMLFHEFFEDSGFTSRGWYDGPTGVIDCTEHAPVSGSNCSLKAVWASGATKPSDGSWVFRHKFTDTDSVYIGFWIKHTTNWAGSGVSYHPHMFYFLTNLEGDYSGLAWDHLNVYVEENCSANNSPYGTCAGKLRMEMQDGTNIDTTNINVNLVNVTENRAVAGCNGDSDGHDNMSCYQSGGRWFNGKSYPSSGVYVQDTPVVYYKNDWHFYEVYFKLNSIFNGKEQRDGIARMWYDGALVYDYNDIVFRTGQYPNMKFNQIIFAPYIGNGSPVNQQGFWIDDLSITTSRGIIDPPSPPQNLRILNN
jgi:hypothetical protein